MGGLSPVDDPDLIAQLDALASAPETRRPPVGGGGLATQDNIALNRIRGETGNATGLIRDYRQAMHLLPKIDPTRVGILNSFNPAEEGGLWNSIKAKFGARSATTPEERAAYQDFKSIQSNRVLQKQIEQKGPQTESDAARMKLAGVQASNDLTSNIPILMRGMADSVLAERKMQHFTSWANKYGLNGVDKQGRTADEKWRQIQNVVYNLESKSTPKIVASLRGGGPKKPAGGRLVKGADGVMEWHP